MYAIIVRKDIITHRDIMISDIIGDGNNKSEYLSRRGSDKFSITGYLQFALIYKTESGAKRIIKEFNSGDHNNSKSKFYWIKGKHLIIYKLTKEEYNTIIDGRISILDNTYNRNRSRLLDKKLY